MKRIVILSYIFFLLFLLFFSYAFVDANLFYFNKLITNFTLNYRTITTAMYFTFVVLSFFFYFLFFLLYKKNIFLIKDIFLLIGISIVVLFLSYPAMLSFDIFNYIATAKVLFFYRENPYIIMPIDFTGDPILSFTRASNKIALYGPIWILITGFPFFLGFGNFILMLFSTKLVIVLFYLATLFTIWKITKNLNSILFFGLHPLVLFEVLISGHNDIAMIFFAILSFYFLIKRRLFLAIIFIILSILIKYATIFLLPIFIYTAFNQIRKSILQLNKIFFVCSLVMIFIFLLSPLREEIYSWYAIWFLGFSSLVLEQKKYITIVQALSFGLLLSYIPYMFSGTYGNLTPVFKYAFVFFPAIVTGIFLSRYIWAKKISLR